MLKNNTLLITGGTGSFGHAVLKEYLQTDIGEIRVFSRDEKKQDDMRQLYQSDRVSFYIGDIRDKHSLQYAMEGVDYIFHAAALKQVPSCEFFPMEAVKTNILGTENVLDIAVANGVKKVICLSTDKAAHPVNAMGISKAMMEKVAVAKSRVSRKTIIATTRCSNVMASRSSVIPLFVKQIKNGLPITITDANMSRFMMTPAQAVELVRTAFDQAGSGDILIRKAPAATVDQLADVLCELFQVKKDIRIIGPRHGEKHFETLLTADELAKSQDMGDYYRIKCDDRSLNYVETIPVSRDGMQDYHSHNANPISNEDLKALLLGLDFIQKELTTPY
ncbi:MAG: polysaccharide biosynthesis protein [Cyclobacteriaceae bacterium]|nr:polysaccharide biosynthesis protein [Cyclobacteriaceae bacterium]